MVHSCRSLDQIETNMPTASSNSLFQKYFPKIFYNFYVFLFAFEIVCQRNYRPIYIVYLKMCSLLQCDLILIRILVFGKQIITRVRFLNTILYNMCYKIRLTIFFFRFNVKVILSVNFQSCSF